jgi:hypothetical protein
MEEDMIRSALYVAAAFLIAGPTIGFAQTGMHITPGEGSRIPVTPRTSTQPLAALAANPSIPGDGYRIVEVPRTGAQPLAAYQADMSRPGDGYRIAPSP